jgi:hypothetical protein
MTHLSSVNVIDPTGLAEHVRVCSQSHARWLELHCAAEIAQGFFASRVVTSGLLLVILMAMALTAV